MARDAGNDARERDILEAWHAGAAPWMCVLAAGAAGNRDGRGG
ncbi:hypothetical protein QMK61_06695 [Fulvimonas sp. R45]|nr:hypothetical protein [Fulvimonas sp. R45]MDO1528522.1 hypothetical protein [Fulvimonas sp. R45]